MRIISGILKGRKLKSFRADHIRPTTDRVKETVFNKLMLYIPEGKVLDLFGGTGNLSIEAYSRGANSVDCVESSKKSLAVIKGNLEYLGISKDIKVHFMDVFKFLSSYKGTPFDVILIDPPFTEKIAHDVMNHLVRFKVLHNESIVMIESSSKERIDDEYPPLELTDRKEFGDKRVSFFKLKGQ